MPRWRFHHYRNHHSSYRTWVKRTHCSKCDSCGYVKKQTCKQKRHKSSSESQYVFHCFIHCSPVSLQDVVMNPVLPEDATKPAKIFPVFDRLAWPKMLEIFKQQDERERSLRSRWPASIFHSSRANIQRLFKPECWREMAVTFQRQIDDARAREPPRSPTFHSSIKNQQHFFGICQQDW